jgi:type IVB pilus formation R64 PilN family outer membrane protein
MRNKVLLAAAAAAFIGLIGCASQPGSIKDTTREIDEIRERATETPIIEKKSDFYVDAEPLPMEDREPWLKSPVTFNANGLAFNAVIERVLSLVAPTVNSSFALDMEATRPVTFTYSGTVKGLFDQLARLTGFRYELNGSKVVWTEFVTKTFDVMLSPGAESFRIGREDEAMGQNAPAAMGAAGGVGGAQVVQSGSNPGDTKEYVNKTSKATMWGDLASNVKGLMTEKGTLMVAESMGTVTVRDRADRVELVSEMIEGINKNLGAQVLIKVRILEVNLNKDFQYGIDWSIVKTKADGVLKFGNVVDLPNVASGLNPASLLFNLTDAASSLNGSSALIKALGSQGDVSIVTQPEVVAVNNRVSKVQLTNQTGYLQSVSVTNTTDVGSQISLTPGVVTDGFTMYFLPRVVNGRVALTVSTNISSLERINEVSSGESMIQTPELNSRELYQNAVMKSGETLVLAGFRQMKESKNDEKVLGLTLLGGRTSGKQRSELLFLITPVVLGST